LSTSIHTSRGAPAVDPAVRLGHPVIDRYLEFVEARARYNTLLAATSDLRVFFTEIDKEPADVVVSDVLAFITAQRQPLFEGKVVRLSDGGSGLMASTIKRRLSSLSGFFSYLVMIGERESNPVPKGLSTRRSRKDKGALVPLVRTPRVLPKILEPAEVDALMGALRRWRDRAMVEAMVLGGLRRCEVLGLRPRRPASRRRQGVCLGRQRGTPASRPDLSTVLPVGGDLSLDRTPRARRDRSALRGIERPPAWTTTVGGRPR
jgi:site-specific recombinase XerD